MNSGFFITILQKNKTIYLSLQIKTGQEFLRTKLDGKDIL